MAYILLVVKLLHIQHKVTFNLILYHLNVYFYYQFLILILIKLIYQESQVLKAYLVYILRIKKELFLLIQYSQVSYHPIQILLYVLLVLVQILIYQEFLQHFILILVLHLNSFFLVLVFLLQYFYVVFNFNHLQVLHPNEIYLQVSMMEFNPILMKI